MGWLERSELEPELERILFLHLGVAMLYLMWEVFCLLFALGSPSEIQSMSDYSSLLTLEFMMSS